MTSIPEKLLFIHPRPTPINLETAPVVVFHNYWSTYSIYLSGAEGCGVRLPECRVAVRSVVVRVGVDLAGVAGRT